ncbi:hypothetical protein [Marinicella sp. W31]|uniref:hypothetical protein n=1 Tax=Marinicella sp. W31 TaxID=3023713 RepID=UPI0037563332
MIKLYKSEWSRIQKLTFLSAAVHIVLLLFMVNFGLLFSTSIGFKIALALFYGFYGFLFAILQMRLYKDENQWVYLLNRPLSERQAFMGLFLAALQCFVISIIAPLAMTTWALDSYGSLHVDWRHYLQLFYVLGVCVSFYLTGVFLTLIRNRWFALLLILPVLPLMSLNLGGQVFLLQAAVVAVLFGIVLLFFRMNVHQTPKGRGLFLLMAIVLQWCAFTSIMAVMSLVQAIVIEIEYFNSRTSEIAENKYPQKFRQVTYLDAKQTILTGLSDLNAKQFDDYRQQTALGEAFRIRKRVWFHPNRQQIQFMDERELMISDTIHKIRWTFSHDDMLFVGSNIETLQPAGYLGPEKLGLNLDNFTSAQRFDAIPWVAGEQFIARHTLFMFDDITQNIETVFSAQPDEYILNVLQQQGNINTVITDRNLYVFDTIEVRKKEFPLSPFMALPLPGDYNNLWDINVIQIKNHFLLSFLYGKDPRKDVYPAEQITYQFDFTGHVEQITSRALEHDEGEIMRYADYLISPLWTVTTDRSPPLPARDRYLTDRPWPSHIPTRIRVALVIIGLFCFALTWHWAGRRKLSRFKQVLWSLSNVVTGLPGLVAFALLHEKPLILSAQNTMKTSTTATAVGAQRV